MEAQWWAPECFYPPETMGECLGAMETTMVGVLALPPTRNHHWWMSQGPKSISYVQLATKSTIALCLHFQLFFDSSDESTTALCCTNKCALTRTTKNSPRNATQPKLQLLLGHLISSPVGTSLESKNLRFHYPASSLSSDVHKDWI